MNKVVDEIEGHFAIVVVSRLFPGEICGAKYKSPLIFAKVNEVLIIHCLIYQEEYYFASDISCIVEYCHE